MHAVCSTLRDAHRLNGTVVILDIYRSSNTILELLHNGAARVVPVEAVETAQALKAAHPDWVLLGERGGETLPGFEGGNSPCEFGPDAAAGRTFILTTSGGTRCIDACGSREFVIGSFANAAALIAHLRAVGGPATFWAVGDFATHDAEEDVVCARYLAALLAGEAPDFAAARAAMLDCPGADRLRRLHQLDDLDYCTRLDCRTVVPRRGTLPDGRVCIVA
ncbi:MAG: 2-phosphosulfolactate phosphatase [Desulfovibrionaceae bacterium]